MICTWSEGGNLHSATVCCKRRIGLEGQVCELQRQGPIHGARWWLSLATSRADIYTSKSRDF